MIGDEKYNNNNFIWFRCDIFPQDNLHITHPSNPALDKIYFYLSGLVSLENVTCAEQCHKADPHYCYYCYSAVKISTINSKYTSYVVFK